MVLCNQRLSIFNPAQRQQNQMLCRISWYEITPYLLAMVLPRCLQHAEGGLGMSVPECSAPLPKDRGQKAAGDGLSKCTCFSVFETDLLCCCRHWAMECMRLHALPAGSHWGREQPSTCMRAAG